MYLDECINSVLSQKVDSWELLLVNDGSTDKSGEICDKYASLDNRIRVIHKTNGGEFSSRLAAIEQANGIYVTGLDADDYYADNYLTEIKKVIDEYPYDCIMWSFTMIGEQNGKIILDPDCIGKYKGEDFLFYIVKSTLHSFCSKAIKMDVIRQVDFSKTPKVKMSEDYIMVIPALCHVETAKIVNYYGYMYRIHGDSTSHSVSYQKIFDLCEVSSYGISILKENGFDSEDFLNAEHIAFIKCFFSRLLSAIRDGLLTQEELEKIWMHPAYIMSQKIENEDNFSAKEYKLLSLFREHQFELLKACL